MFAGLGKDRLESGTKCMVREVKRRFKLALEMACLKAHGFESTQTESFFGRIDAVGVGCSTVAFVSIQGKIGVTVLEAIVLRFTALVSGGERAN